MGFWCRCKNCMLDFIDDYGEFVNGDDEMECPRCGSTDVLINDEIPNEPEFGSNGIYDIFNKNKI